MKAKKEMSIEEANASVTLDSFRVSLRDMAQAFAGKNKAENSLASFKAKLSETVTSLKAHKKALNLSRQACAKEIETLRTFYVESHGDTAKVKSGKTTVAAQSFSDWKVYTLNKLYGSAKATVKATEKGDNPNAEKAQKSVKFTEQETKFLLDYENLVKALVKKWEKEIDSNKCFELIKKVNG